MLSIIAKGYSLHFTSPPLAPVPLGNTISQGLTEASGNARANIPNASKESNHRDTPRYSRVLFERIPLTRSIWRVVSSSRLKTTERPY